MKKIIQLNGIYPPVPTPFHESGEVAPDALKSNLSFLNRFALRGFVVLGSNGEYVMLTEKEKLLVLEAAREAIPPSRLMIAGTGCQSTVETVNLTKKAAKIGSDAALVITPSYYRGLMSNEALTNHFRIVADESPIPILLYNMPACTGIDLDTGTVLSLAQHPNIIGMKDSSGNVVKMAEIRQEAGPGFQVLAGSGGFLLPALSVGAMGGIMALANLAPAQCIAILQLFLERRQKEARDLQVMMIPVNTAVTSKWGVAGLKAAMDSIGLYGGPTRLPLLPLSDGERQHLDNILAESGLIDM